MNEEFKIYTDRLRKGHVEQLDFKADPSFIEVDEKELKFKDPVAVWGEAYLADSELVLRLKVSAIAQIPCSICNATVQHPIEIEEFYFTKPLSEIKSHIFDFSAEVREAILLEVPFVVECSGGNCPQRKDLAKFLAPPNKNLGLNGEVEGWQPFKDL